MKSTHIKFLSEQKEREMKSERKITMAVCREPALIEQSLNFNSHYSMRARCHGPAHGEQLRLVKRRTERKRDTQHRWIQRKDNKNTKESVPMGLYYTAGLSEHPARVLKSQGVSACYEPFNTTRSLLLHPTGDLQGHRQV